MDADDGGREYQVVGAYCA